MIRIWGKRAPRETINQYIPYWIGSLKNVPFLPICQGWTDRLGENMTETTPATGGSLKLGNTRNLEHFAPHGKLQIGGERLTYTSISGRTLNGILRGADGTTPTRHGKGEIVYEWVDKVVLVGCENPKVLWSDGFETTYRIKEITQLYVNEIEKATTDPPTHTLELQNTNLFPGHETVIAIFNMLSLPIDTFGSGAPATQVFDGIITTVPLPQPMAQYHSQVIYGGSDAPEHHGRCTREKHVCGQQVTWVEKARFFWLVLRSLFYRRGRMPQPILELGPIEVNGKKYIPITGGQDEEDDGYGPSFLDPSAPNFGYPDVGGGYGIPGSRFVGTSPTPPLFSPGSEGYTITVPAKPQSYDQTSHPLGAYMPAQRVLPQQRANLNTPRMAPIRTVTPPRLGSVTADAKGVTDTDGRITGTVDLLIERPAHVTKFLMAAAFQENHLDRYGDWSDTHNRQTQDGLLWALSFTPISFDEFIGLAGLQGRADLFEEQGEWLYQYRLRRTVNYELDARNLIGQPQFATTPVRELATVLEVEYGIHPDTYGTLTLINSPYVPRLGQLRGRRLSMPWVHDRVLAEKLATYWYAQWDHPRLMVAAILPLEGIHLGLTNCIRITTPLTQGYDPQSVIFEIRGLYHRMNEGVIELTGVEIDPLSLAEQVVLEEELEIHIPGRAPGVGAMMFSGYVPGLDRKSPNTVNLILVGQPPTLDRTNPETASLILTGHEPTISRIFPGPAGLALTGQSPTAFEAAVPGKGTLTLTGYAPTLGQENLLTVPAGSLTGAGQIPTVQATSSATPPAGNLVVEGHEPSTGQVFPGPGSLVLAGQSPGVQTGGGDEMDTILLLMA